MVSQNRKSWVGTSTCKEGSWIPGLESAGLSRCRCSHCAAVLADTAHWTSLRKPLLRSPVTIGDRVAVKQSWPRMNGGNLLEKGVQRGVVKYVGDLNSPHTNDPVFVGVKLDDPVGEHDGMFAGKRFFSCPESHGLILPATEVQLLATNNQRKRRVGTPKSVLVGSVRPAARRESGLESMLNKSWARNRISAVSGANSCRERKNLRTSTPNDLSGFRPGETQTVMNEKMSEGAVIGGAPAANYSNEGDMCVEDVERHTSGSPTKMGRRKWRSVPVMRGEEQTTSESRANKTRALGASEIIVPTTRVEKSRTGTDRGENGAKSSVVSPSSERRGSKYTSLQLSGLSGALYSMQGSSEVQQRDSVSPTHSESIGSPATLVKNVESSLDKRQGDPRSPSNWTQSSSESITNQQYCQPHSSAHTHQTDTLESSEEEEELIFSSSSSSTSLPPVPPGTSISSSYYLNHSPAIQDSLDSCTMSWTPTSSSCSLPSIEQTVTAKTGRAPQELSYLSGGPSGEMEEDMRVQMMTNTYHKLRKALKRGMREIQWQRKIQEIESSGLYPTETRRFEVLRESADLNMKAAVEVKKKSSLLKRRKGNKLATVATAQAKLESEEGKGQLAHSEIMSYPSSADSEKIRDIKKMARNVLKRTK